MKGLLIKDFKILLQQKKIWIIMFIISMMILFSNSDIPFVIGYITMVSAFVAISTISYDEMDNGYLFLFTLPIETKGYVFTKYILSVIVSTGAWGAANILCILVSKGMYAIADFYGAAILLLLALVMQFVVIPLQLKYGAEKSRIVYLLIFGGAIVLGILFEQFGGYLPNVSGVIAWIEGLRFSEIASTFVLFALIVALISFACSCRVMNRKQL